MRLYVSLVLCFALLMVNGSAAGRDLEHRQETGKGTGTNQVNRFFLSNAWPFMIIFYHYRSRTRRRECTTSWCKDPSRTRKRVLWSKDAGSIKAHIKGQMKKETEIIESWPSIPGRTYPSLASQRKLRRKSWSRSSSLLSSRIGISDRWNSWACWQRCQRQ